MEGPPRWTSRTTVGISAMEASPSISVIRERPGPDVDVIDLTPANDAPTQEPSAESSSSVWITEPPTFGIHSERKWSTSDEGVIG